MSVCAITLSSSSSEFNLITLCCSSAIVDCGWCCCAVSVRMLYRIRCGCGVDVKRADKGGARYVLLYAGCDDGFCDTYCVPSSTIGRKLKKIFLKYLFT